MSYIDLWIKSVYKYKNFKDTSANLDTQCMYSYRIKGA